jgi:hypothetical protein
MHLSIQTTYVGYYNDIRDALTVLGSMFNVDSHKSITVGGVKTGATSTPNLSMSQQNKFTLIQSTPGRFYFNPFLESHNQLIPPAKYDGTVLKLNG